MPDPSINALVNLALERWVTLTGTKTDPGAVRSIRLGGDGWDDFALDRALQDLNASRELDPTGLSTFMLLRGLVEEYLGNCKIPVLDFLVDAAGVEARLAPLRAMREILEEPRVVALIDDFATMLRESADHYGLRVDHRKGLEELLGDKLDLAYLRRDALRSLETLEAHQFVQGQPCSVDLRVNPMIFEFWNIQSLLQAMQSQPDDGITLCMIRDPQVLFSFFVVAIRSGHTLTVLTDRQETPHPDFKKMSRARGQERAFCGRVEQHWFPYHLLDLEVSEDQKDLRAKPTNAIVPVNAQAVKISSICDLPAPCFIWAVLLFDLLRTRYGLEQRREPQPSYTADMVVEPHALCSPEGALVKDGVYQPLVLAPLTAKDVTQETLAPQWRRAPKGLNAWMVERYGARVPDAVLNPVGEPSLPQLASGVAEAVGQPLETAWLRGGGHSLSRRSSVGDDLFRYSGQKEEFLRALDPLSFGTRADLERDRLWVARMNQVAVIQTLALEEFDRTKEELVKWYTDAIGRRSRFILEAVARGSLVLPSWHESDTTKDWLGFDREMVTKPYEALSSSVGETPYVCSPPVYPPVTSSNIDHGEVKLYGGFLNRRYRCHDRPEIAATVFTEIRPNCAAALVSLLGLKKTEDLPWQMQHWTLHEPYHGNSILDRLDPIDWKLTNPWRSFTFRIWVSLSKNALNARRTALCLPRRTWPDKTEKA